MTTTNAANSLKWTSLKWTSLKWTSLKWTQVATTGTIAPNAVQVFCNHASKGQHDEQLLQLTQMDFSQVDLLEVDLSRTWQPDRSTAFRHDAPKGQQNDRRPNRLQFVEVDIAEMDFVEVDITQVDLDAKR